MTEWLAFGSLEFLAGLVVAKAYVTVATVGVLWLVRDARKARAVHARRHAELGDWCPCLERS